MSPSRSFLTTLALLGLGSAASAQGVDLSGYRTVETALKAEVKAPAAGSRAGRSGYLGISTVLEGKGRVTVEDVDTDSPAAKAGILPGDVVQKLGDREVRSPEALRDALQQRVPGETVELRVQRKRKKLKLSATLGANTRPLKSGAERPVIGVQLGEPREEGGVSIRQVTSGMPAERAGVKSGDVILKVEGQALLPGQQLTDLLATRSPGETVTVTLQRDGQQMDVKVELAADASAQAQNAQGPARNVWTKEVYRLAVIGIEYPDVKHNPQITPAAWEESLFSKGTYVNKNSVTGQAVHGSMNDFFHEQSYGKFRVEGKMFDWVTVSRNRADYSQGTGTGSRALLTEALDRLLERDGAQALEGYDGVFFLYAGDRFRTTRGGLYWPHRASVRHKDKSWSYFIVQEGGPRMTDISVFCHEFGHMLGLPDLYARPENPGSEGLGVWCLMSNQTPNGRPQHMSAWCKERLGWITPTVIDPTLKQKLVLSPINGSNKECFKVLVRPDGSEYLLLENRKKTGFDQSLPADGLLIWRVVVNRPILEESHGVEGPEGPRVYPNSVPYPSPANTAYTPYTVPSSRSQLGGGLPVHLTHIRRLPDGRIAFQIGYEFQ